LTLQNRSPECNLEHFTVNIDLQSLWKVCPSIQRAERLTESLYWPTKLNFCPGSISTCMFLTCQYRQLKIGGRLVANRQQSGGWGIVHAGSIPSLLFCLCNSCKSVGMPSIHCLLWKLVDTIEILQQHSRGSKESIASTIRLVIN
jgi:hypothetical protein